MSARAALFAAILANPDDDTARLVHADALEESGAPVAVARARFTRLQIQQSAAGFGGALPIESPFNVQTEIDALARVWARAWLAELSPPVANAVWNQRLGAGAFRRGFVDGVTLPVRLFREHAEGLFAASPVTALQLHGGLGARQTAALFAAPHFRRLRAVRLSGGAIGARVTHQLAKSSDLGAVRDLDLSGCELGDQSASVLARFVERSALDVLRVRNNRLTWVGIDELLAAARSTPHTRIVIGGNPGASWIAHNRREHHTRFVL